MERARETREEIGVFSSPRTRAPAHTRNFSLISRSQNPRSFWSAHDKRDPWDEVALPYKKQRLLRRIGLL